MSTARTEILAKIRSTHSDLSYEAIQRNYRQGGTLDADGRLHLFEDRLRDYGATVYRSSEHGIKQAISDALTARRKKSMLVSKDLPAIWLTESVSFVRDENLSYVALDSSEGVLTTCALATAETGTIVLQHSPENGRRVLTLIPDYHLCIVHENQIVESVVEGIRKMAAWSRSALSTISGPSATSDIEMTRIQGVHGPRTLDVILVEQSFSPA